MKATIWDYAVILLTASIFGVRTAIGESRIDAALGGAFMGLLLGALFCTFVRLVMLPLHREVETLSARVAELERRGGPGA